jgi:hypothetical protein
MGYEPKNSLKSKDKNQTTFNYNEDIVVSSDLTDVILWNTRTGFFFFLKQFNRRTNFKVGRTQ